mgnify:CR=1 FL=1
MNIPDGVKSIGSCAFWYCRSLESLDIPDSYSAELWTNFIDGCTGLKKLKLSKNISKIEGNLSGLTSLQEVNINNGSANYMSEDGVLYNKDKTELICYPNDKQQENYVSPESLIKILNGITSKKIKSITLLENVSEIKVGFADCLNLEMINVDKDNQYYSSEDGILYNKDKTELICYPNNKKQQSYVMPDNLTETPWDFSNKNLKSITLSKNITNWRCFSENFENLQELNVNEDNLNYSSEDGILYNKDKTEIICWPSNKQTEKYITPDNLKILPWNIDLSNLKSITLGKSIEKIDYYLGNLNNLQEINVNEENQHYSSEDGVLFDKNKETLLQYPNNKEGESYTIPISVKKIGKNEEYDSWKGFGFNEKIKRITLTRNVEQINFDFSYCTKLQEINVDTDNSYFLSENGILFDKDKKKLISYPPDKEQEKLVIPKEIERIDCNFGYCTKLKEISVDENNNSYSSEDGILFNKDKTILLYYPANKDGESYTIPTNVAMIGYFPISEKESIYVGGFGMNKSLKNIMLNANVNVVELNGCEKLQEINVDKDNQYLMAEDGVLFTKNQEVLISYPNGKEQTSYTIPNTVKLINFAFVTNLKELVIPSGVENVHFFKCPDLKVIIKAGSNLTMRDLKNWGLSESQVTFE